MTLSGFHQNKTEGDANKPQREDITVDGPRPKSLFSHLNGCLHMLLSAKKQHLITIQKDKGLGTNQARYLFQELIVITWKNHYK
jgi:hypothetical protein